MRKVLLSVNECVPGMQTAETVFNEYGAVVIGENTIIDDHILRKFKNLGIEKIKVFDASDWTIDVSDTEIFAAQYNQNVKSVKTMLHDISTGKELDVKKINEISDSIIIRINENRDILRCINELQTSDEYTYTHCVNVSLLCMLIGKWMKLDYKNVKALTTAGFLHDIGKAKVPHEIINKPGQLTSEEFEYVKKHTVLGFKIAEAIPGIDENILKGILLHHEREDGTGYPLGLKGNQIHQYAKIIAVADIYDAMTSNRCYRGKETPFDVFMLMENNSFGTLDRHVVNAFLKNIAAYYIGDFVKLSTGDIGEIVYINPQHVSQPIVRVENVYIDLSAESMVRILELI